jgi:hypothetical protein
VPVGVVFFSRRRAWACKTEMKSIA